MSRIVTLDKFYLLVSTKSDFARYPFSFINDITVQRFFIQALRTLRLISERIRSFVTLALTYRIAI